MADPIDFGQSNSTYRAGEGWGELKAWRGDVEGRPQVISKWRLTPAELARVSLTGCVYLQVLGTAQPPVKLSADPFGERIPDERVEWKHDKDSQHWYFHPGIFGMAYRIYNGGGDAPDPWHWDGHGPGREDADFASGRATSLEAAKQDAEAHFKVEMARAMVLWGAVRGPDLAELLVPQVLIPGDECALFMLNRPEPIVKLGRVVCKIEPSKHDGFKVRWEDGKEEDILGAMLAKVVRVPGVGPIYLSNARHGGRHGFAGVMILAPYAKGHT